MEPPAAVPLNNELAAARGELYGAEEAVLWRLTGDVGDARYAIQDSLDKVRPLRHKSSLEFGLCDGWEGRPPALLLLLCRGKTLRRGVGTYMQVLRCER